MNRIERNLSEPIFLATAAVSGWKHLFANEACVRIVFDSLDFLCRTRRMALYAFTLLPSHLYLLCRPLRGSVQTLLTGFADYTGSRMAASLQRRGRGVLMHYMHSRSGAEGPGAPTWGSLRIEEVRTPARLLQLLAYIHDKPVSSEWQLASERSEYLYSSACFYDLGRIPIIEVSDARREISDGS
jgi:putative transposase